MVSKIIVVLFVVIVITEQSICLLAFIDEAFNMYNALNVAANEDIH